MTRAAPKAAAEIRPPEAPALVVGARRAYWLSPDGELESLDLERARARASGTRPILCHRVMVARRLGLGDLDALDLLELFAFAHPARFTLPTPAGLARALGLSVPAGAEDAALALLEVTRRLLADLAEAREGEVAARIAFAMARAGWGWGPAVLAALGGPIDDGAGLDGLDVWNRLEPIEEEAPPPPPGEASVGEREARERLARLLGEGAESRPRQSDYAALASRAFAPRDEAGQPRVVLAEAGTGIGKTLGYIAPASLWAERNGGTVWLSTFTRNLQRQIDQELDALYPDPETKAARAVVRKGRENYLCLLNLEEAARGSGLGAAWAVPLGLMARWAGATRDGDMVGGDFPAWLIDLLGPSRTLALTDSRGECIYSACRHYRRCFIEKVARRGQRADIVIANHALVMVLAALGDDPSPPLRIVFDEGHHVFDAADGVFSTDLSGRETAELRRWLAGAGARRGRARGLAERVGDLVAGDDEASRALDQVLRAARALPGEGWLGRLASESPLGPTEGFLVRVRAHVMARVEDPTTPYGLEASTFEPAEALLEAARALDTALAAIERPLLELGRRLAQRLDDEAGELDTQTRIRIEAACRGMRRRAGLFLGAWRAMLARLDGPGEADFVDWLAVERSEGHESDVAMRRHWVYPTVPFAKALLARAHGALITSATLRDRAPDAPDDWTSAEVRTGALHLPAVAARASLASPFDYPAQTRVLVVTDVRRNDGAQVAAAYRELFLAAGGGALGLFTAVQRLRGVHRRIAGPLEDAGLSLLAQHVDAMDTGTLVDIFREEVDSCLLGTDAVRDGVDVPGRSLRLIVFDRVPWPRPDILHRARRAAFGGRSYDDMMTRLRLKQAYGRLIRGAGDRGSFVMLDAMLPSRLATAFPEGVEVRRLGLAEAVAQVRDFLDPE